MPLPMPETPAPGEGGDDMAPPEAPTDDPYTKAARVIRHAMQDGDDEAAGEALHNAIKACLAEDKGGEYGDEGPPEKPNLALLIAKKKKD